LSFQVLLISGSFYKFKAVLAALNYNISTP
jgi:hypothetical protein